MQCCLRKDCELVIRSPSTHSDVCVRVCCVCVCLCLYVDGCIYIYMCVCVCVYVLSGIESKMHIIVQEIIIKTLHTHIRKRFC